MEIGAQVIFINVKRFIFVKFEKKNFSDKPVIRILNLVISIKTVSYLNITTEHLFGFFFTLMFNDAISISYNKIYNCSAITR